MAQREVVKKFKAIVAAARRVDVSTATGVKETVRRREDWQEEFWAYYDEVPELKFALNFLANGMQKVRFFAAVMDDNGIPIPINAEGSPLAGTPIARQAEDEMARLRNGLAGQGELNRLLTLNLEGPGECSLHGMAAIPPSGIPDTPEYRPGRAESWDVRSVSEIEISGQTTTDAQGVSRPKILIKRSPSDKGVEFDPDTETLIRFWQRHPRYTEWADSLARATISDCEMLTLFAGEAKSISKSRHNAGAFTLPSELSFVDDSDDGDEPQEGDAETNPFIAAFMRQMVDPVTDPSSPSSVQRLVISGPAEFLKPDVLRTIDLSRSADDKLTEKMDRHINRLARGLNVPVEVVMGHMSTTFSNAEQIDQDTFDDYFQPRCVMIADGYTNGFLRPQLEDGAVYDPAQVALVLVGFDASELVHDDSMESKADALFEHGAITAAAYRKYKGASEDDAPDEDERLRAFVERKAILTADLALAIFKKLGIDLGASASGGNIEVGTGAPPATTPADPTPPPTPPPADNTADPAVAAAGRRKAAGTRLMEIDRSLRQRLAGAVDMAMSRALERAGNKLKTAGPQQLRASIRGMRPALVAAHLGPSLIADAGLTPADLLDGAWDDLGVQFKQWANEAGDSAIAIMRDVLGTGFSERDLRSLKARQINSIDEGWMWLDSSLSEIGKAALFSPELETAALGEIDALSHVPTGILREALIRAGGATGFHSAGGVVTPSNRAPLGGIATGEDMMDALNAEGGAVEGYVWVYGPARRRGFEPHEQLNGTEFENFDDAVLANSEGWPDTTNFYPGDHNGCVCDFEPVIIGPPPAKAVGGVDWLEGDKAAQFLGDQSDDYTAEERDAAQAYMNNSRTNFNQALRRVPRDPDFQIPPAQAQRIAALDSTMRPLGANVVTYRGIAINLGELAPGDKVVDAGFMSTSVDATVSKDFGGTMLRIEAPRGTPAAFLNNIATADKYHADEVELVLGRGVVLEVQRVEGNTIHLRAVAA